MLKKVVWEDAEFTVDIFDALSEIEQLGGN